ncbi:TPA: hypothetical protein DCG86_05970 [Candidatus Marinimicrobia bacterium]|nr:hypothetical protein [Candidatus Neomarinimicrobiota bacterium]
MISLVDSKPVQGELMLNRDGSFTYYPQPGFTGYDSLTYTVYDGQDLSTPNVAVIYVGTGAGLDPATYPEHFTLSQNYPNPFNTMTTIEYTLSHQAFVELTVYNTLGNQISLPVRDYQTPGVHTVHFNGESLASGIYSYILKADGNVVGKHKMVLLK